MNFIDQAEVTVLAGKGGDGRISFHKEKFISKGGPDGGDGGNGGDVILKASFNQNSLAAYRYSKYLAAKPGQPGSTNNKHGKSGDSLIVAVPVGTEVIDDQGIVIADLTANEQAIVIAKGGKGGFGNAHFVSSKRQAPNFADKGEPGEEKKIKFELKMLADIGLVGLPNAGKSTLLKVISNAKPKVADYPFTTLQPSVGVVDIDKSTSLLFADIPGLIEGAAEGKGLGHDFLRHIERTSVIVHLIDAYSDDPVLAYLTVRKELEAYKKELIKRPEVIAITKCEGLDQDMTNDIVANLRKVVKPKTTPILAISAFSKSGIDDLIRTVQKAKHQLSLKKAKKTKPELYEYRLESDERAWKIEQQAKGVYIITGDQINRFALRTDFKNDQAVARLLDILKKRGVMHALIRKGLKPGDKILFKDAGEIVY